MDEAARVDALIAQERLPSGFRDTVDTVIGPLARRIVADQVRLGRPMIVGLCGSQGSGKSTFALFLAALLETAELSTAVLSLDDLYLTSAERRELADRRHPLLATRGPPGTHDVALGLRTLEALTAQGDGLASLPRFNKAQDTRAEYGAWPKVETPVDVVLFEGWLVGARPQPEGALTAPVNVLEREEDVDGDWRGEVNRALADSYQDLFERLDLLVLLEAPGFEHVQAWRTLQERKLALRLAAQGGRGEVMDEAAIARFIMHYERLTRWILQEMPGRADVVIRLGSDHEVVEMCGA